ncbi:MAG: hypothetical protein AAF513_06995 [Pseudomonadota bacterium]
MTPALIHINSYPGVGKLTIARALAAKTGAKVLDNHSIYNVAFALTEFKSEAFYSAVKDVRAIAYRLVAALPEDTPVILTNAHADDSAWGNACWDEAIDLAEKTGRAHHVVLLDCAREENEPAGGKPELLRHRLAFFAFGSRPNSVRISSLC